MKRLSKNSNTYNLVFNEPKIKILEIKENKNGSVSYTFEYNKDFEKFVRTNLKLSKNPTKKQITDFILQELENTIKGN